MSSEPGQQGSSLRSKWQTLTARGRRLAGSESVAGAARLASGTAAGQIILVASSPILTRLYSPGDFGSLATFTALVGLVIIISSAGYHLAIMLPDTKSEATTLVGLALVLVVMTSVVTAVVAVLLLAFGVFADSLGAWILLWPLAVFMGGSAQVLSAHAIRYGGFGLVAGANLLKAAVTAATQIAMGVLGVGKGGLIGGSFLGFSSANVRLARPVIRDLKESRPTRAQIRAAARKYSQFPKHTMPATLVNAGFLSGTPLVVGWLFGTVTLGFWSLANTFVYVPSTLVGQAVGQAYYRKAVAVRHSVAQAKRLFDRTALALAGVSIVPFTVVALLAPFLFALVFGEEWRIAGQYAQVMMPAVWMRFVTAPVSTTSLAHEANRVQVFTSAIQVVAVAITVVITLVFSLSMLGFLIVLSALLFAAQALALLLFRRTIGRKPLQPANEESEGSDL